MNKKALKTIFLFSGFLLFIFSLILIKYKWRLLLNSAISFQRNFSRDLSSEQVLLKYKSEDGEINKTETIHCFAPTKLPETWSQWKEENTSSAEIFYFPPGQQLKLPDLLSNYRFVSVLYSKTLAIPNSHQPFMISQVLYDKVDDFENEQLIGAYYDDNQGGIWLEALFKALVQTRNWETGQNEIKIITSQAVFAHGQAIDEIEEMINTLGRFEMINIDTLPESRIYFYPQRVKKRPSSTMAGIDIFGKEKNFSLYVPPGYTYQEIEYRPGYTIGSWENDQKTKICLNQLNSSKNECRSPGGACTNSRGTIADFVVFAPNYGAAMAIESVPICDDVEAEHVPWGWSLQNRNVSGGAFNAKNPQEYTEVLNLYYMLESVEPE